MPTIDYAVIANPSPSVILSEAKNLNILLRVNSVKQSRNSAGDCHGLRPRNDPSGQFCRHDFKSCRKVIYEREDSFH